jgi:hypothetical protein
MGSCFSKAKSTTKKESVVQGNLEGDIEDLKNSLINRCNNIQKLLEEEMENYEKKALQQITSATPVANSNSVTKDARIKRIELIGTKFEKDVEGIFNDFDKWAQKEIDEYKHEHEKKIAANPKQNLSKTSIVEDPLELRK